jgi:hypothetical protein
MAATNASGVIARRERSASQDDFRAGRRTSTADRGAAAGSGDGPKLARLVVEQLALVVKAG